MTKLDKLLSEKAEKTQQRRVGLFLIAVEGSEDEPRYFEKLKSLCKPQTGFSQKIQIEVLKPENTESAPEHVLNRLSKAMEKYEINTNDDIDPKPWVVIDVDVSFPCRLTVLNLSFLFFHHIFYRCHVVKGIVRTYLVVLYHPPVCYLPDLF